MEILEDEEGGMGEVAAALRKIGTAIKYAGSGDNADQRGAIEVLSISLKDGLADLSRSVRDHGRAVAGSLDNCADAVRDLNAGIRERAEWVGHRGLHELGAMVHDLAGNVRAAGGEDGLGAVADAIGELAESVSDINRMIMMNKSQSEDKPQGEDGGKPSCQDVDAAVDAAPEGEGG